MSDLSNIEGLSFLALIVGIVFMYLGIIGVWVYCNPPICSKCNSKMIVEVGMCSGYSYCPKCSGEL